MNQKEELSKVIQTFMRKVVGSNFGQNTVCVEAFVVVLCKCQDGTLH